MKITRSRPLTGSRPTVSVVIPCYNYGHYLPFAVGSVTQQSGVDLEIIIVDDASTDDSWSVAVELAAADPRIRLIRHAENARHIATYNDGLNEATGDYVVLLSADDLLAPGSLERSCALMEHHPEVGLVYGYAPDFTDQPPVHRETTARWSTWRGSEWISRICVRGNNIIVNPEAILRRSVMQQLGGYNPDLPQSADMELWMRAAAVADVGRINGPVQGYYRVHGSNMHVIDYAGLITDMMARASAFDSFFESAGSQLIGADTLRDRVHRTIASEAVGLALEALRHDGAIGGSEAAEFVSVARQIWPRVTQSSRWRRYERERLQPAGGTRRKIASVRNELSGALRWRVWRRYGI